MNRHWIVTAWAAVVCSLWTGTVAPQDLPPPVGPDRVLVVDEEAWPHFNWLSFDQDKLVSFGDYQYSAYWGADMAMVVVRRDLRTQSVQALRLAPFILTINPRDAHRNIVVGISPGDGRLHLSWDHHNNDLRYTRTREGFLSNPPQEITADDFEPAQQLVEGAPQSVTYPRFFNDNEETLFFCYRSGSSGRGDIVLFRYDPSAGKWVMICSRLLGREGVYPPWNNSPSRNAYLHDVLFDARGRLHITWVYREAGATWASNHDLHYAFSDDNAVTWKNNAGEQVADTRRGEQIVLNSPGIMVREIPVFSWLMNQCAMTIDSKNRPHVATYHMPETFRPEELRHDPPAAEMHRLRYYHYWRDDRGAWRRSVPLPMRVPATRVAEAGDLSPRARIRARPAMVAAPDDTILIYFATGDGFYCHAARSSDAWQAWKTIRLTGPEFTVGDVSKHDRRLLRDRGILSFTADRNGLKPGSGFAILDFAIPRLMHAFAEQAPLGSASY